MGECAGWGAGGGAVVGGVGGCRAAAAQHEAQPLVRQRRPSAPLQWHLLCRLPAGALLLLHES